MIPQNTEPFIVTFKNEHIIYENIIKCTIKAHELNLSYNPSLLNVSSSLNNNVTGSEFTPYFTTVGLYNDSNELVAVAKLGKPIVISSNTDMTINIKWDF